jgi:hypothetical protein
MPEAGDATTAVDGAALDGVAGVAALDIVDCVVVAAEEDPPPPQAATARPRRRSRRVRRLERNVDVPLTRVS